MSDAFLFAFGCGVTFLCLAGMYVWFRRGFQDLVPSELTDAREARGRELVESGD